MKAGIDKQAKLRRSILQLTIIHLVCLVQLGTFDSKEGEFEYLHKPKMNVSRRRFFL